MMSPSVYTASDKFTPSACCKLPCLGRKATNARFERVGTARPSLGRSFGPIQIGGDFAVAGTSHQRVMNTQQKDVARAHLRGPEFLAKVAVAGQEQQTSERHHALLSPCQADQTTDAHPWAGESRAATHVQPQAAHTVAEHNMEQRSEE